MKLKQGEQPSPEHEAMYHAASCCQAASFPLTARRLHGLKKTCPGEGKKTGSFASPRKVLLRRFRGMQVPGRLKCCRNIQQIAKRLGYVIG